MKKKKEKKEKTFLDRIKLDFKKTILGSIILNLLFLLFGIIIFMNPYMTASSVGVIIGIYFILFGLFDIYEFLIRREAPIFTYRVFGGILSIIIGIFIMFDPFKIVKILTFALGLYLIVLAVSKLLEALKLKKIGYDGWLIILVTSILLLIFGVFITINPMVSMDLVEATAIFIILSSILEICNLFMIYSKAKELALLFKKVK